MVCKTRHPGTNKETTQTAAEMALHTYHDAMGHFGPKKTEMNIHRRFYWVGMAQAM